MTTIYHLLRRIIYDEKLLFQNSTWTFLTTLLTSGFYVIETMILARYLPKDQLGMYILIISFPEFVQAVLDLRVNEIMIKYLPGFLTEKRLDFASALVKLLWISSICISLLGFIFVFLSSNLVARNLLGNVTYSNHLRLFSLGVFIYSFSGASLSILRVFDKFPLSFAGSAITAIFRILLMVISIIIFHDLHSIILSRTLALAISAMIFNFLSFKICREELGNFLIYPMKILQPKIKEIARFALFTNISSTFQTLSSKVDVLLLATIMNPAFVAIYKLSVQLARTWYLISDSLMIALYPQLSHMAAEKLQEKFMKLIKNISCFILFIVIGIALLMLLFGKQITVIFAGLNYAPSSPFFSLATYLVIPAIVLFWTRPSLMAIGKMKIVMFGNILGGLVGIILQYYLSSKLSITGAICGFGLLVSLPFIFNLGYILIKIKTAKVSICS